MNEHTCGQCECYRNKPDNCPHPEKTAFDEGCDKFKYTNPEKRIDYLQADNKRLKEALRWIPADDPPDDIEWDKKVLVLEYDSKIPITMTMAEVFLDEGSEAEYWKPIILPDQALKDGQVSSLKSE